MGITYRNPVAKVCNDCPFRRVAGPGWLGAGSPESFIDCINRDEPLPCHQTIDYDGDPDWKTKWTAQTIGSACAGSLILRANMCKEPRNKTFPRMKQDKETVFATPLEFVKYHRDAKVHSWDEDDQSDEAKFLREVAEKHAKKAKK